jgi:flagellar hook assembly protein FlgD
LRKKDDVTISITDAKGALVSQFILNDVAAGRSQHTTEIDTLLKGGIYFLTFETSESKVTRKLILRR